MNTRGQRKEDRDIFTLPFLIAGITLNILSPRFFQVGGPGNTLKWISVAIVVPGVIIWIWSVVLMLVKVPRHKLITTGPYALMLHPLYTGVALLVLPWIAFLLNTWLGLPIGLVLYTGPRIYSPEEEKILAEIFGEPREKYRKKVLLPWL
ncbi:MAG: isoprenylcysteine carboxylmethyltransferase family protein [Bacteroidales bacterium]